MREVLIYNMSNRAQPLSLLDAEGVEITMNVPPNDSVQVDAEAILTPAKDLADRRLKELPIPGAAQEVKAAPKPAPAPAPSPAPAAPAVEEKKDDQEQSSTTSDKKKS